MVPRSDSRRGVLQEALMSKNFTVGSLVARDDNRSNRKKTIVSMPGAVTCDIWHTSCLKRMRSTTCTQPYRLFFVPRLPERQAVFRGKQRCVDRRGYTGAVPGRVPPLLLPASAAAHGRRPWNGGGRRRRAPRWPWSARRPAIDDGPIHDAEALGHVSVTRQPQHHPCGRAVDRNP